MKARPSSELFIVTMWLMSAPPMKALPPAPENTTTRRSSSRASDWNASVRSSSAGGLSTFSRRALSNTTCATTPAGRRSQEMSTLCAADAMTFRSVALCRWRNFSIRAPSRSFTRANPDARHRCPSISAATRCSCRPIRSRIMSGRSISASRATRRRRAACIACCRPTRGTATMPAACMAASRSPSPTTRSAWWPAAPPTAAPTPPSP